MIETTPASAPAEDDDAVAPERSRYTDRALVARLWRESLGQRRWLIALTVLELLAPPLYLLMPLPLKVTIDSVIGDAPVPGLLAAVLPPGVASSEAALLAAVGLLQVVVVLALQGQAVAVAVVQSRTGELLTFGLRQRLFRHIQAMSFAFVDRRGTADSIYRVQYDTPSLQNAALYGLIPLFTAAATVVAVVVVITGIDVRLAIVGLLVVPVLLALMRGYKVRMRPAYRRAKRLESAALHVIQETLGAFRVVKAFGREEEHARRFSVESERSIRARVRLTFAEGLFELAVRTTTAIGTAAVLYIGAQAVLDGGLSVGDLTLVMAYLAQLFAPVRDISNISAGLQNHFESAHRVFEVLDTNPQVAERPDARAVDRVTGAVRLSDVSFSYAGDDQVLAGVDLDIPAGTRVGVFGPTGAGKTTLLSLVMRILDPTSGRIELDGVNVADYRLADLREQFSVVLQDSVLFSTTIAENIAYGRPGCSQAEIERAARMADAHDFVSRLPEGYSTTVGERGMRLSGGERQRISLARAFLKDAPVQVLDEPTSSVDRATEDAIMAAMERLTAGRTTFMIAHRLATLETCDMFVKVADGTAVEVSRDEFRSHDARPAGADPALDSARGTGHPPLPPSDEELIEGLRAVLATAGIHSTFRLLRRQPDGYAPPGSADLVMISFDQQSEVWLRCHYYRVTRAGHDEPYEVHVHRRLLDTSDLASPRLVGTATATDTGTAWVVTEFEPDSWRLDEIATVDAMRAAARWLADFHRANLITGMTDAPDLRPRRAPDYLAVVDAALRRARTQGRHDPWLEEVAAGFPRIVEELLDLPLTVTVGNAYATNLLISGQRVMPIDFSEACIAPGELDLAQLIDGWPEHVVNPCVRTYRRARWPDGPPDHFERRLDICRVHAQLASIADPRGDLTRPWDLDGLRRIVRVLEPA